MGGIFAGRQANLAAAIALGLAAPASGEAGHWCRMPADQAAAARARLIAAIAQEGHRLPAAFRHVHTEHTLPGDPIREASLLAERDWPFMLDNALAWRAGGGEAYLRTAERFLGAWAAVYRPDFNPIDETRLDSLIETYAIVRERLDAPLRASAERLIRALAEGYVERMKQGRDRGAQQSSWTNNWQSHRVKLVTLAAAALGDPALFAQARRAYDRQLTANIRADGSVIDFAERDALHYVVYDLEPLLRAALAARAMNEDWYGPRDGRPALADAVRWLEPYARGVETHMEFAHSSNAFDAERVRAGVAGFSGPFEPRRAAEVFWLAAAFELRYAGLARALAPQPPNYLAACGL
jgi:hypothetical protein